MADLQRLLGRFRKLCLALPETEEVEAWGHPTFRVGGKIFAGFGEDEGQAMCSFKATHPEQRVLVERPGFSVAAYVGRYGWVSHAFGPATDWNELQWLVTRSYALIAPKRLAKLVGAGPAAPEPAGRKARSKRR